MINAWLVPRRRETAPPAAVDRAAGTTGIVTYAPAVRLEEAAVGKLRTSEDVVATGLRALDRGKPIAVDGLFNRVQGFFAGLAPAAMTSRIAGNLVRPRRDASADASKRPTL